MTDDVNQEQKNCGRCGKLMEASDPKMTQGLPVCDECVEYLESIQSEPLLRLSETPEEKIAGYHPRSRSKGCLPVALASLTLVVAMLLIGFYKAVEEGQGQIPIMRPPIVRALILCFFYISIPAAIYRYARRRGW